MDSAKNCRHGGGRCQNSAKNPVITSGQTCSVSMEIIDLTVTRGMLWYNNLLKSADVITLYLTKVSLWWLLGQMLPYWKDSFASGLSLTSPPPPPPDFQTILPPCSSVESAALLFSAVQCLAYRPSSPAGKTCQNRPVGFHPIKAWQSNIS